MRSNTCPRGRKSQFQREIATLDPRVWLPMSGADPWRCRITGTLLTSASGTPGWRVTAGRGRDAVTGTTAEDMSATFTNLSGLAAVSWMAWVFRPAGGSWLDQSPLLGCDFFAASGRGVCVDARTSSTNVEVVRTSSAVLYYQGTRNPAVAFPEGRWALFGMDTDLNSASAPNLYIDGILLGQTLNNNTYTTGTMDASVTVELRNPALNQFRDGVLLPFQLSALEWGRLAQMNPLR